MGRSRVGWAGWVGLVRANSHLRQVRSDAARVAVADSAGRAAGHASQRRLNAWEPRPRSSHESINGTLKVRTRSARRSSVDQRRLSDERPRDCRWTACAGASPQPRRSRRRWRTRSPGMLQWHPLPGFTERCQTETSIATLSADQSVAAHGTGRSGIRDLLMQRDPTLKEVAGVDH